MMPSVFRAVDLRVVVAALLLGVSLSGCDMFDSVFGNTKVPLPGTRLAVFTERTELEPDKEMASVPVVLPAPLVNESWPQSGGFANNAMYNLAVGDSPQIIWTADVGAGTNSSRILTTPPVVAEGKVFAKDAQGTVSAFSADTGQLVWRVSLKPEKARDADEFGGGLAYYGGRLYVTTGYAVVYSLDPSDGHEIWNSTVSASRGAVRAFGNLTDIRGRPVIDRNTVLAMGTSGQLAALELRSGQRVWDRAIGGYQTPWVAGQFLFVTTNNADVVALSRSNGKIKWVTPLTQFQDEARRKPVLWSGPVLAGNRLLITGSLGDLLAVSPYTGEVMGKVNLRDPVRLSPVIANRTIYVLTDSGRLIALR